MRQPARLGSSGFVAVARLRSRAAASRRRRVGGDREPRDRSRQLPDRSTRAPTLTDAGRAAAAGAARTRGRRGDRSDGAARAWRGSAADARRPIRTSRNYEETLMALERRFPALEPNARSPSTKTCSTSRGARSRLMAARAAYPADIGAATIAEESEIGLFVGRTHALAEYGDADVPHAALRDVRELRLCENGRPRRRRPDRRRHAALAGAKLPDAAGDGRAGSAGPNCRGWSTTSRAIGCELRARGWPRRAGRCGLVAQPAARTGRLMAARCWLR